MSVISLHCSADIPLGSQIPGPSSGSLLFYLFVLRNPVCSIMVLASNASVVDGF